MDEPQPRAGLRHTLRSAGSGEIQAVFVNGNGEGAQGHGPATGRVEVEQSVRRNDSLPLGKLRKVQEKCHQQREEN